MLTSLLLILDDQGVEHGSIDLGIRWSREFDALLVALGTIDDELVHPVEAVPIGAGSAKIELDAARLHDRRLAIGTALSAIALKCAKAQAAFKPLECIGHIAEEITIEAQRYDLIIMPRQAAPGGACEWHIGQTLRTILRSTPRPVVAVPTEIPDGNAVVVAYDGSLQAARAVYAFAASGIAAKRSVHLISVDDDPVEAARRGNRAIEFLGAHNIRATLCPQSQGSPTDQILKLASEVNAGLIVLGAYGKPRIQDFFVGSVTSAILAKSPLPLFLFH
jgi:nucleotide-binding universal stress UspA family protein